MPNNNMDTKNYLQSSIEPSRERKCSQCSCDPSESSHDLFTDSSFAQYEMCCFEVDQSETSTYLELDDDSLFQSVSSMDWDLAWREADSVYAHLQRKEQSIKKVRFGYVEVREFALAMEFDQHDCHLELSWTHAPTDLILPLPPNTLLWPIRTPRRLSLRERQLRLMDSQRSASKWRTGERKLPAIDR